MTRDELQRHLAQAAKDGTLLTPKHDPDNLSTIYTGYRSVLSHDLADNLELFIDSGEYTIKEYENINYPNSPLYFEIEPTGNSSFSIPGSGVPPYSPFATSALDRIIAVSGNNQGWHVHAENCITIQQNISAGTLIFKGNL